MYIPQPIRELIGNAPYTCDSIGKSGSAVLCYAHAVLKIEPAEEKFAGSVEMLQWLKGRLPVSEVLCAMTEGQTQYLLMSRVPGRMACDPCYTEDPDRLAGLLAEAIQALWSVDIAHCPKERRLSDDLLEAEQRVAQGLIDLDDTEPETFGPGGFKDPEALLYWLKDNQPPLEPALSHGDLCLPNVFFENGRLTGFIDLGDCGISDKWRDLALCRRSLHHNISGHYAVRPRAGFDPDILFAKLSIVPDREKLRYYLLLDELF